MLAVILAAVLPVRVACTNCNATGWVGVPCFKCGGKGVVVNPRHHYKNKAGVRADPFVPCSKCLKGLTKNGVKGSGKVRRTCPVCKGLKKVRVKGSSEALTADGKK